MVMRNPLYLDLGLLQNTADYHGIGYSVETEVIETGKTTTGGAVKGAAGPIGVSLDRTKGTERQEAYKQAANPFRVMNDVLDALEYSFIDLNENHEALNKGDLVIVEAELTLTATSEVGSLLGKMMPLMAAGGGVVDDSMKNDMLSAMVGGKNQPARQLYKLTELIDEQSVLVPVEGEHFFRQSSYDDLDRDVTIVAVVDRVVPSGSTRPLDTWLLPDMDRTMRRALKGSLDAMLATLETQMGIDVEGAKTIVGPALEIRPLVIY